MTTPTDLYKRSVYLIYYLYRMDWPKFWKFFSFVRTADERNVASLWADIVSCVYKYNIGLIDYFYFRFFEKGPAERAKWVGTGYKYEYDLIMNPVDKRHVLQNKIHFFDAYAPFIRHAMCTIEDLEKDNDAAATVLSNESGKIAIKDALGQCGWDVEIRRTDEMTRTELVSYMRKKGFNLAEEFIVQHPELSRLSDTGLNTVRIITQLNHKNEVAIIGPTLRITVNSPVDNMAVGNIAAPIDIDTGILSGLGAYQDITKAAESVHPVTGVSLIGFQVPYWEEAKELCRTAALHNTSNRSIAWDVAITRHGPSFVEGNHNWCKLLWQLPAGEGLKSVLDYYLEDYLANNPSSS
jgi:hypothetical protein